MLFVTYVVIAALAVLNVATSLFCQNAIESAQHDVDIMLQRHIQNQSKDVKMMKEVFSDIDVDDDGTITITEFEMHLNTDRGRAYMEGMQLPGLVFRLAHGGEKHHKGRINGAHRTRFEHLKSNRI